MTNNEFKKTTSNKNQTVYTLESASSGGTSSGSIASSSSPIGGMQRRKGDNLIAQEAGNKVPSTTPRNFVAKNAKSSGAGAHKDKKKEQKQGTVKHKKPFMEDHSTATGGWGQGSYDTYSGGNHGRGVAEEDDTEQEVSMAGSELYGIAKHAKELLALIHQQGQQQGLEAWQQSKITKAADYLNAVLQSLDYDTNGEDQGVSESERRMSRAAKGYEKYGKKGMMALAKAGREGASDEKLDNIRDRHDHYNEGATEGLSKRDQKDVAAIKAAIERLQSQLKQPNADKAAIQQSIAHERKRLALYKEGVAEEWSQKYKSSINCSHPKGFSQKAHCAGKKKHEESMMTMEAVCPDCGMCQTHGNLNEIKKGAKDSNGFTKCWPGHHAAGTKKGKNGGQVRNCVPNEGVAEGEYNPDTFVGKKGTYKGYGITQEGPSQWGISSSAKKFTTLAAAKRHIDKVLVVSEQGVAEALDSNFVGFMNKTLGQKTDTPTAKSPMPDFMKGAPVAGLDTMGYKAALNFGMKTLNKLTPTQKTKLSIKGEDGVVNWLANQAKKQGLLITDEGDEDNQGKFMQEDLDEVQDFLPEVFHDPAIKSWAFVLTDGEPLPKAPVAGPFKVITNPGIPGQNGYANAEWKTIDTLENLSDARELAQGLAKRNPKQFVAISAANGKSAGIYWPGEGWKGINEGVAEGMDPDQRARLDDLIDQYRTASDPEAYYGLNDEYGDPDEIIGQIRQEFGDNIASKVEAGTDKMHYPRQGHSQAYDRLSRKDPVDRTTKGGKMFKQDSDFRKNNIAAKFRMNGKKGPLPLPEGDAYMESLQNMLERQLEPTMDLDVWVDNFQNADPSKYHQFKNKSPEKKK